METAGRYRAETLKARDNLTLKEWEEKSKAICDKFFQIIETFPCETIFIYVSYRSEVDTLDLIKKLLASDKIVAIPLVQVSSRKMHAIRLLDLKNDLVSGYYGILEPKESIVPERTVDHSGIDVVVLPGAVFDENGGRIGYGGGFYDTFLAEEISASAKRIALSFDLQVKQRIPQQSHDESVDYIITEKRLIAGLRSGNKR